MLSKQAGVMFRSILSHRRKLCDKAVRGAEVMTLSRSERMTKSMLPYLPVRNQTISAITQFFSLIDCNLGNCYKLKMRQDLLWQSPELRVALQDSQSLLQMTTFLTDANMQNYIECLLSLAISENSCMKANIYEQVAHMLARRKNWRVLLNVVTLGRKHLGRSTVRLMNWRTRALVEMKCFTDLWTIMEEFSSQGLKPNRRTFSILLEGHLRNHDIHKACRTLKDMEDADLDIDSSTYVIVARAFRGLGANIAVQNRAYKALEIMTASTKSALLDTLVMQCLEVDDMEGALFLLDSHTTKAHQSRDDSGSIPWPSARTFVPFLRHCAAFKDKVGLSIILRLMRKNAIIPNVELTASLIYALYAMGLKKSALAVLSGILKGSSGEIDVMDQSNSNADLLSHFKCAPTIDIFNAWIKASVDFEGYENIQDIFHVMNAVGITPDVATSSYFFKSLEKYGKLEPIQLARLWRILKDFANLQTQLPPPLLHQLIASILRHLAQNVKKRSWNISAFQYRHVRRRPPNVSVPCKLSADPLAGLASQNRMFKTVLGSGLQSLSDRGVKPDRAIIAMRMRYDAVINLDIESALSTFDQMLELGMLPTAYHYAALIEGYAKLGDMDAAEDILQKASANGIRANVVMHTILIVGYAQLGKPDCAFRAFEEMIQHGVKADFAALDAVTSAFYIVGDFSRARQILVELWPLVAPFPNVLHRASLKELVHAMRTRRDNDVIKQGLPELSYKYVQQFVSLWKGEISPDLS